MKINKKIVIVIVLIFLLVVLSVILICFIGTRNKSDDNSNKTKRDYATYNDIDDLDYSNIIDSSNDEKNSVEDSEGNQTSTDRKGLDVYDDDLYEEFEPVREEDLILETKTDEYSYFVVKQCLSQFYSNKENAYNTLDTKLRQYDISNFYNDMNSFCIDEINKASIKLSKNIYYVYYRIQTGQNTAINKQIMIKIDTKNASFYVYPYEYLESINYLNLKSGSKILLDVVNIDEIPKTEYNHFNQTKIKKDESACIKELFERFKFDVNYDLKHLYNLLDEEYKNVRFGNDFQNFSTYMNSNKELYLSDIAYGYQKYDLNWYTQYIIICQNDHRFVYNMIDLMNYSIQLDYYTTAIPAYIELYNSNFPHIRAKYCIDRVKQAINEGNYEFIYAKLNPVQKSNYYNNYNDFVNFIKVYFYKLNIFEYGSYSKISDDVYEYSVTVKNEMDEKASRKFKMTIKLKEEADFSISITF